MGNLMKNLITVELRDEAIKSLKENGFTKPKSEQVEQVVHSLWMEIEGQDVFATKEQIIDFAQAEVGNIIDKHANDWSYAPY